MAVQTIPTLAREVLDYTQRTTLDGVEYVFRFLWNTREEAWYFDLSDANGDPIAMGRKVVVNWPLMRGVTDARRPPGALLAIDTTGTGIDPGLSELGERVQIRYFDAEEAP